jgi:hypothetical protein
MTRDAGLRVIRLANCMKLGQLVACHHAWSHRTIRRVRRRCAGPALGSRRGDDPESHHGTG